MRWIEAQFLTGLMHGSWIEGIVRPTELDSAFSPLPMYRHHHGPLVSARMLIAIDAASLLD